MKTVEGAFDIGKLEAGNYAVIPKLKYMDGFHAMINSYRLIGVTLVIVIAVIGKPGHGRGNYITVAALLF